ncbi:MAG: hypothetical protein GF416_02600 [Candidatus Altiarchaeales archaeon]|nr:hypothetical protein [Candidatus Altiarchaeales archaeon]MBD3416009.1 hypothetical protein [Candidatus Altiarchaeales archaeon]
MAKEEEKPKGGQSQGGKEEQGQVPADVARQDAAEKTRLISRPNAHFHATRDSLRDLVDSRSGHPGVWGERTHLLRDLVESMPELQLDGFAHAMDRHPTAMRLFLNTLEEVGGARRYFDALAGRLPKDQYPLRSGKSDVVICSLGGGDEYAISCHCDGVPMAVVVDGEEGHDPSLQALGFQGSLLDMFSRGAGREGKVDITKIGGDRGREDMDRTRLLVRGLSGGSVMDIQFPRLDVEAGTIQRNHTPGGVYIPMWRYIPDVESTETKPTSLTALFHQSSALAQDEFDRAQRMKRSRIDHSRDVVYEQADDGRMMAYTRMLIPGASLTVMRGGEVTTIRTDDVAGFNHYRAYRPLMDLDFEVFTADMEGDHALTTGRFARADIHTLNDYNVGKTTGIGVNDYGVDGALIVRAPVNRNAVESGRKPIPPVFQEISRILTEKERWAKHDAGY